MIEQTEKIGGFSALTWLIFTGLVTYVVSFYLRRHPVNQCWAIYRLID